MSNWFNWAYHSPMPNDDMSLEDIKFWEEQFEKINNRFTGLGYNMIASNSIVRDRYMFSVFETKDYYINVCVNGSLIDINVFSNHWTFDNLPFMNSISMALWMLDEYFNGYYNSVIEKLNETISEYRDSSPEQVTYKECNLHTRKLI